MNRSFLIIFIPALFVAAGYLYLGIRPPLRAEIGVALFVVAIAVFRLKAKLHKGKPQGSASHAPGPQLPAAGETAAAPSSAPPPAAHQP